ncbi:isoprenylcysteine carboxyl methyltransferase family protein [Lederbergia citrea]|uniref:Isoprenylcysteine carboxyl methyltransferase n=1 Tax=Lederbergia citrea TaxID=2833581 RepID=A0A942Z493_9BACI|nr:isoprenylcysteine carboxylmethyltransferase family protein [Lederbergia citrea]MBS4176618.1 hypothetical protein [Lederbergia citrea]MBS4203179.1 hypothetical protein [Lederbergia citrea]MBS4222150.1 hypothetical protein [Lederbergia citrea]
MFFIVFLIFLITQRLVELGIAKRNEHWMKKNGAIEYGQRHYKFMVLIHIVFFISLITEVLLFDKNLNHYWIGFIILFGIVQIGRIWVIATLGKFWNTKIIVLPGIKVVAKGPFKYVKHPNYIIVTIELLVIPLMFNAYLTAALFFILNQLILAIRIPAEEKALKENTDYTTRFE